MPQAAHESNFIDRAERYLFKVNIRQTTADNLTANLVDQPGRVGPESEVFVCLLFSLLVQCLSQFLVFFSASSTSFQPQTCPFSSTLYEIGYSAFLLLLFILVAFTLLLTKAVPDESAPRINKSSRVDQISIAQAVKMSDDSIQNTPLNPYASLYAVPTGPGDGRPTALQVIRDNNLEGQLSSKVAFVTGGTSAVGIEIVRALHATGADVYFTAQDYNRAYATRHKIWRTTPGRGRLKFIILDMDSLASVKAGANEFLKEKVSLNILVNNACKYYKASP